MSTSLPSAEAAIRAAHECAVPVLVGGRAFGPDSRRADRLGADGWANDVATAVAILDAWHQNPPGIRVPPVRAIPARLVVDEDAEQAIVERISADLPPGSSLPSTTIRDHVRRINGHVDASIAIADDRIFSEFTEWFADVLAARGHGPGFVTSAYRAIDDVLGQDHPAARSQLRTYLDVTSPAR